MLNVDTNRLNYAEILMPPENYVLEKAIATSYSLDLYTLLSIPIALFYSKNPDLKVTKNDSVEILSAIQKTEEIVSVFYQKGKLKIPEKFTELFAYVENAEPIVLDEPMSSFHPKIWILRFKHKKSKSIRYRLIVLSRNLTFDNSWDIAFTTDGEVEGTNKNKNLELVDFVNFLYSKTKKDTPQNFLKDLKKVNFDIPENIQEMLFHPIVLFKDAEIKSQYQNPILDEDYDKLLIISPFIDKTTLDKFAEKPGKKYLFSRKEELDNLVAKHPKVLKPYTKVYHINKDFVTGPDIDDEDIQNTAQNLHAKVFVLEKNNNFSLFMGSANCSKPAFERNVEFMVQLNSNDKRYSVENIKSALLQEETDFEYFVEYDPSNISVSSDDEEEKQLRILEYDLINAEINGKAIKAAEYYNVALNYNLEKWQSKKEYKIFLNPYNEDAQKKEIFPEKKGELLFKDIGLNTLSSFVQITVFLKNKLVLKLLLKADIEIPKERNESIFKTLVSTTDKFFQYLNFLIAKNDFLEQQEALEYLGNGTEGNGENMKSLFYGMPVYEKLLVACSRNPDSIKEVSRLIEKLRNDEKIIPQEFLEFWKVISEFSTKNRT